MKSNVAHVVYRQLLCQTGHGYPLWTPEPDQSLPHAFQQRGISVTVGDVGILTERGGFDFLFNIHEAASGEVNENQVPPGFEPWFPAARDTSVYQFIHKERSSVVSSTVSRKSIMLDAEAQLDLVAGGGFSLEFTTEKDQAAVLVLPHGATGYDTKSRARYKEYARKNAEAWYRYANVIKQYGAANGTLYLVTGCDKARSWATAAVSQPSQTRSISLKFLAGGFAESTVSFHSSWSHDFDVETRIYPPSTGSPTLDEVHCVFTRGFTIAVRQNFFDRALRGSVQVSSTAPSTFPKDPPSYWPSPGPRDVGSARSAQITEEESHASAGAADAQQFIPSPSLAPSLFDSEARPSPREDNSFSHSSEGSNGSDVDMLINSFLGVPEQLCNPSSVICTSILKHHQDIDVAIVHDEDWALVLRGLAGIPDSSKWFQFLSRIAEDPEALSRNMLVEDSGCAVLSSSWQVMMHTCLNNFDIHIGRHIGQLSNTNYTVINDSAIGLANIMTPSRRQEIERVKRTRPWQSLGPTIRHLFHRPRSEVLEDDKFDNWSEGEDKARMEELKIRKEEKRRRKAKNSLGRKNRGGATISGSDMFGRDIVKSNIPNVFSGTLNE